MTSGQQVIQIVPWLSSDIELTISLGKPVFLVESSRIDPVARSKILIPPPFRITSYNVCYTKLLRVVCLNAQGRLVHNETIYPHPPQNEGKRAGQKISTLVQQYKIEAIAIGTHLIRLGLVYNGDGGTLFGMAMMVLVASLVILRIRKAELAG